jgi:hypothetical protein
LAEPIKRAKQKAAEWSLSAIFLGMDALTRSTLLQILHCAKIVEAVSPDRLTRLSHCGGGKRSRFMSILPRLPAIFRDRPPPVVELKAKLSPLARNFDFKVWRHQVHAARNRLIGRFLPDRTAPIGSPVDEAIPCGRAKAPR